MKCNMDCFNCIYSDCINDDLLDIESTRLDREVSAEHPLTPQQIAQRKYKQSAKGKEKIKRYNSSQKAKDAQARYNHTEKARERFRAYNKTPKRQAYMKAYREKRKLEKLAKASGESSC